MTPSSHRTHVPCLCFLLQEIRPQFGQRFLARSTVVHELGGQVRSAGCT
jgi:hypothetical protein